MPIKYSRDEIVNRLFWPVAAAAVAWGVYDFATSGGQNLWTLFKRVFFLYGSFFFPTHDPVANFFINTALVVLGLVFAVVVFYYGIGLLIGGAIYWLCSWWLWLAHRSLGGAIVATALAVLVVRPFAVRFWVFLRPRLVKLAEDSVYAVANPVYAIRERRRQQRRERERAKRVAEVSGRAGRNRNKSLWELVRPTARRIVWTKVAKKLLPPPSAYSGPVSIDIAGLEEVAKSKTTSLGFELEVLKHEDFLLHVVMACLQYEFQRRNPAGDKFEASLHEEQVLPTVDDRVRVGEATCSEHESYGRTIIPDWNLFRELVLEHAERLLSDERMEPADAANGLFTWHRAALERAGKKVWENAFVEYSNLFHGGEPNASSFRAPTGEEGAVDDKGLKNQGIRVGASLRAIRGQVPGARMVPSEPREWKGWIAETIGRVKLGQQNKTATVLLEHLRLANDACALYLQNLLHQENIDSFGKERETRDVKRDVAQETANAELSEAKLRKAKIDLELEQLKKPSVPESKPSESVAEGIARDIESTIEVEVALDGIGATLTQKHPDKKDVIDRRIEHERERIRGGEE